MKREHLYDQSLLNTEPVAKAGERESEQKAVKQAYERFMRMFPEYSDKLPEDLFQIIWMDALDFSDKRGVWTAPAKVEEAFDEAPKIMWRVFEWAYDNGIEVTLRQNYGSGSYEGFPTLRFSRGRKHIEQSFYPATDLTGQLESIWRKVALELCVVSLDLTGLDRPASTGGET